MKSFLKYTLATIVGIVIVNLFLFVFFIGLVGAIATLSEKSVEVKDNSLLVIRLDREILDRVTENPWENFDFLTMTPQKSLGMNQILKAIKTAAEDDRIIGIYLELNDVRGNFGGLAFAEEIRNALEKFRKSGKFIYSYSNLGYSQKGYYLASVADKVFVNPEAPLLLSGLSSNIAFYKETLEKLGVQAEVVKVGKFKSAVEPFISTEMSAPNREQIKRYLDSSWGTIVEAISQNRHIPVDTINEFVDRFDIYTPKQFKEKGYFENVVYEDEMIHILKRKCNVPFDQKLNQVSLTDYLYAPVFIPDNGYAQEKIAVIYAQGEIGTEQSFRSIGPELAKVIRKAREDEDIKAIVLRVNSPGGNALTSDIIWRETELARQVKPLVVSMGNVAASGGYYISCAADVIVAEPTTLTGSIGIFGLFFNGEEFIQEKMGIHTHTVKTHEHSDFGGSFPLPFPISSRPLTAYERNVLQNYVNQGYETFLSRVWAGRTLYREQLDSIAQGRVWTGKDAQKIGLVDELGGLEDAIWIAANNAGLKNYRIVEYPTLQNPIEGFISELTGNVKTKWLQKELGAFYPTWQQLKDVVHHQGIMARVPYDIDYGYGIR